MKKFTSEHASVDTIASMDVLKATQYPEHYMVYIGLDVHKNTIAVVMSARR